MKLNLKTETCKIIMKDNKQRIIHFHTTIQFFVNKKEADKNEKKKEAEYY